MGWQRHSARNQALRFRQHTLELVERMAAHSADTHQRNAHAKQGRQQLDQQWAQERQLNRARQARAGWHAPLADDGADAAERPS
jgi:glutathione-regulated potassium-efflux system ancillary protein KefC